MQQYIYIYIYPSIALYVSGDICTHHQKLITLHLQYLALMGLLPLLVVDVDGWELQFPSSHVHAVTVLLMPDTVGAVLWAPEDGWKYHPKHVEHLTDINKLYTEVYWTVHHLDSWIKIDQLDVTCFIISLFTAQHVSNVSASIFRSLRLIVDLFHVLYCSGSMCVGVTVWFGWGGVVSVCRQLSSK
jgi:hypothetical protein